MAKTIDQLLRDADDIIEKRASAASSKVASATSCDDSDIEKMASALLSAPVVSAPVSAEVSDSAIKTPFEKVAQAIVIVETLMNLDTLPKIYAFEKAASDQGYTPEQIAAFMPKIAEKMDYKRLLPLLGIGVAATAAGAGGAYVGHRVGKKRGEKAGYTQALSDVDKAMKDYQL